MKIKFFNGRKLVYTVVTNNVNAAIDMVESANIDWTRYKIK